jgi:hypothetical protein
MNTDPNEPVIRISAEEAASSHVDDMLKRQMSLRGEPGVARDHGRRWYYQNWFVFSIVGMLAAIAAWALIEPMFADRIYLQGPIEKTDFGGSINGSLGASGVELKLRSSELGWIQIKGEKIWIMRSTRLLGEDGSRKPVEWSNLKTGQNVGVYLEYLEVQGEGLSVGDYVTSSLKHQSASRASMTLRQLSARASAASLLLFPLMAGLIGLSLGAVDGIICRLPRRALLSGLIGLVVGFIGGFISNILAGIVYAPLSHLAMAQTGVGGSLTGLGFMLQMIGRSLAWALAGSAMGLGQGIALRSPRLLIYGLLGGIVGGLLGGLSFDPIDLLLLGDHNPSAAWSRLIGFSVIGLAVGGLIGVVELLARDAWLRMTQGPLAGKEFLLFKDVMNLGSSPRSDIYLFNDPLVLPDHAILRAVGDEFEIESRQRDLRVLLNNRPVQQARLRHGDQVTIGRTLFVFEKRKG